MVSTIFNSKIKACLPWKKALFLLATLVFATVSSITAPNALAAEVETLHGINLIQNGCTITVTSTGCTNKESFITLLQESQPPIVTFIRVKQDPCRARAHRYDIKFSLKELGATKFTVGNPFDPGPEF